MENRIALGVLAGGKSSRMGQNKALMEIDGQTMLSHAISLGRSFDEVLVSADRPGRYDTFTRTLSGDVRFVYDELDAYGPLEGIYQLLKATSCDYVLAIATDLPFLTEDFLRCFADEVKGDHQIYVLTIDGDHPEPLCSIYGTSILTVFEEMRKNDIHRPRMLFDRVNVRYIDIGELGFETRLVQNVNTPEEYDRFVIRKED